MREGTDVHHRLRPDGRRGARGRRAACCRGHRMPRSSTCKPSLHRRRPTSRAPPRPATTVEEHSVIGGLGSASVADVLCEQCPTSSRRLASTTPSASPACRAPHQVRPDAANIVANSPRSSCLGQEEAKYRSATVCIYNRASSRGRPCFVGNKQIRPCTAQGLSPGNGPRPAKCNSALPMALLHL